MKKKNAKDLQPGDIVFRDGERVGQIITIDRIEPLVQGTIQANDGKKPFMWLPYVPLQVQAWHP